MSNKYERVLSDDELWAAAAEVEWQGTIGQYRLIEQAVLAKLAELEPLGYADKTGKHYFNDLGLAKRLMPDVGFIPLYAHPIPSVSETEAFILRCDYCKKETDDPWHGPGFIGDVKSKHIHACDDCVHLLPHPMHCIPPTSNKEGCVSEIWESDTQRHLEHIKRYQKWRRGEDKTMTEAGLDPKQIGESLDWLIGFAENHTEEARVMASPECLELISKTGAPRRDGYGWDDESTPSNKVIIQLMAKYHLQMLLGSDFEKVMDFGRDAFNYAIGEYVNMRGEKVGGDHIPDIREMIPEGWQLVPKEPTGEMRVNLLGGQLDLNWYDSAGDRYKAMLAAAPKYTGENT